MVKIYSLIHRFCGKTQGDLLRKEVFQYILLLIWQLTDFNLRVRLHLHSNFTVQRILFALFFMHIWKARKKRIKELFVNFCIDRKKNPEIKWLGKDSLITQKKHGLELSIFLLQWRIVSQSTPQVPKADPNIGIWKHMVYFTSVQWVKGKKGS
jgi:hypothetical protein